MKKFKKLNLFKRPILFVIVAFVLLGAVAVALLCTNIAKGGEPATPKFPSVYFEGEYRIGDGEWRPVVKGEHISSTKGDVTLRGSFHMHFPEDDEYLGLVEAGLPISFYMDHIGITVYEEGQEPYVMDNENSQCGVSACGQLWLAYSLCNGGEEPIELVIHNPHKFGNETAIDEFLSELSIWVSADFDRAQLSEGAFQRNCANIFIIIAFIFLGTAIFISILKIKNSRFVWLIGFSVLFAGVYLLFSSNGVCFWNHSVTVNTTMLCISGILYMLFVSVLAACSLNLTKRIGALFATLLGVFDAVILLIPIFSDVYVYDVLWIFGIVQSAIGVILGGLLIYETLRLRDRRGIFQVVLALLLIAFAVDTVGIAFGFWKGGVVSSYLFVGALMFAAVFVLQIVPQNIVALTKARETELKQVRLEAEKNAIEAELKETRISTMLSQIQPHFIYNTLGTIERLCIKDPERASELVRNFSLYLRGNFSELDSIAPIRFSQEIKHVEHYVDIEKVRFPDMTIEYKLEFTEFVLPALSVQPLVENAIKHGLMRLESGGTVVIHSYETETHFCVEVSDNGVGFDTDIQLNKKEHVGIYNIRERLKAIVNGTLQIESELGVGTVATIMIPKEDGEEKGV